MNPVQYTTNSGWQNKGETGYAAVALVTGLLLALLFSSAAQAQHEMHNMSGQGNVQVTTMPENNEVLAAAPDSVMLHLQSPMRLVKLVLKDSARDFIDIGFRYQPSTGVHFMQALPPLPQADYYTVEWALLDATGALIKGNFFFSFGSDARPPSYYLEQMEHPQHIMAPDYRLLN